jgi:hypothetical protein
MYSKITNPKTGRKVDVNGRLGKNIVRNYLMVLNGGAAIKKSTIKPADEKLNTFLEGRYDYITDMSSEKDNELHIISWRGIIRDKSVPKWDPVMVHLFRKHAVLISSQLKLPGTDNNKIDNWIMHLDEFAGQYSGGLPWDDDLYTLLARTVLGRSS